MKVAAGY